MTVAWVRIVLANWDAITKKDGDGPSSAPILGTELKKIFCGVGGFDPPGFNDFTRRVFSK